jgi:hypothetical protein
MHAERVEGENEMVTLGSYTDGVPGPDTFSITTGPIPQIGPGQVLCRTLFLSLDPYVRVSMLPPDTAVPTGAGPLPLGSVVGGRGVSQVVASQDPGFAPGDVVAGETGWQRYSVAGPADLRRMPPDVPPSTALGVLGMPGFTGWSGLRFIGRPAAGETVVVSAASGAVGSLVVQLARRWGCRAVGIAGSDEKCRWVEEELGADRCVSHRSPTLQQDLADACPDGVDVYFDNVGGDVLLAVLANLNRMARVIVCGRIAHLNADPDGPAQADRLPTMLGMILTRGLVVQGFTWSQYADRWDEFVAEVAPAVAAGEIRFREDVVDGLDRAPSAFGRLFDGSNFGKLMVRVG